MAKTREFRIRNLFTEFLTNALIVLGTFQTAGTVTARTLQAVADHLDHFFIIIQSNSHISLTFLCLLKSPDAKRQGKFFY